MQRRQSSTRTPTLDELLGWMAVAKENLPEINDALIGSDQILEMSALLDRMQRVALALAFERDEERESGTRRIDRAA
jgi:hypothetical protein